MKANFAFRFLRSIYNIGGYSLSLRLVNFVFQRVFLIDFLFKYPKNFTSRTISPRNITIEGGRNNPITVMSFAISGGCYIQAEAGISLGMRTRFAPRVSIVSTNHDFNDLNSSTTKGPITIGSDCWLGTGSVVLSGVTIGPHTVVAANAVVTKSFPDGNCVLAGVPARVIKQLSPIKQIP